MSERDFINQLQRRLMELRCPHRHVRRLVREVADHREDLRQAAVQEGLSGAGAEAWVDARLGEVDDLAEQLMVTLRRSTWWGRHSLVTFGVMPLLAVPLLWSAVMAVELCLEYALGFGWNGHKLHAAGGNAVQLYHVIQTVNYADYIAMALVSLSICWLARRWAVRPTWMVTACVICSLYAWLIWIQIDPHRFTVGLGASWPPHWKFKAVFPLLVAGATWLWQPRIIHRFRRRIPV